MSGVRNKLNRTIVKSLKEPGRYNDGGGLLPYGSQVRTKVVGL